jgi:hypothetical protein
VSFLAFSVYFFATVVLAGEPPLGAVHLMVKSIFVKKTFPFFVFATWEEAIEVPVLQKVLHVWRKRQHDRAITLVRAVHIAFIVGLLVFSKTFLAARLHAS